MIPILYEKNEDGFLTNGIGRLTDTISCRVTEERNGKYELEMMYPATGLHFDMIQNERILYVRHSDGLDLQPFRIYRISKPMNGKVMIYARHKSYDLLKMTVMPCTAETCAEALEEISSNTISGSKFSYWTDKTTVANFKIEVPTLVRSALGGTEGSVLDTFGGGEYEFDHDTVKLHANRGVDSGVTIRYGKNLRDFTQELNADGVITGVAPFWLSASEDKTVVTLPEGAVIAASSASGQLTEYYWDENEQIYRDEQGKPYETNADTLGIVPLDLSADFKDAPTVEQLRAAAVAYLRANAAKLEETESIKISFVHLWQTEEYENVAPLQRLRLCDTATVYYPQYEVEVTAKVVKTVYNVLLERYDSMELGDARRSYAKTITGQNLKIQSVKKEVEDRSASMMAEAINHATQMITGGLGGYVVMKQNADGEPEEILIMDTDDISTAVNVIRMNKNGIAFSRNGYNGTYRTAWTIDGNFVADFITTGTLNANLIKAGTMSADRILGGTIKLGGASNKNGVLEIYNSLNQRVGRWDYGALYVGNIAGSLTNPKTKISADGKITTKNIEIDGGSIKITDAFSVSPSGVLKVSDGTETITLSKGMMKVESDGKQLGFVGANKLIGTNYRGIVFDLDTAGDYMTWASKDNPSESTYTMKLAYTRKAIGNFRANTITAIADLFIRRKLLLSDKAYFDTYSDGSMFSVGEISFGRTTSSSSTKTATITSSSFTVHNNKTVHFYCDLNMHGYDILNQSDIRLKKNIKDTEVDALEIINSLAVKQFDWISGGHKDIGLIAQQAKVVDPNLVDDSDGLSIKITELIPYLIRAVQQLSEYVGLDIREAEYKDKYTVREKEEYFAEKQSAIINQNIKEENEPEDVQLA